MTRCWRDGVRVITSCESKDFLHWSAPREVLRGSGFSHQVYAMPVFPYQGLYLGLAAIFHEGDRDAPDFDTVDCELYYAVTPDVFDAVAEWQPFIPRGTALHAMAFPKRISGWKNALTVNFSFSSRSRFPRWMAVLSV